MFHESIEIQLQLEKMFILENIFLLTSTLMISFQSVASSEKEKSEISIIWEAAKDMNRHYKIKEWIVHHDNNTSYNLLKYIAKDCRYLHFIEFNDVTVSRNMTRKYERTFNLYISQQFDQLEHHFPSLTDSNNDEIRSNEKLWIINIPNRRFQDEAMKVFRYLPLRYDSLVFEFIGVTNENGTQTINIHEVYKIKSEQNNILTTNYAEWNPISRITINQQDMWNRRSNFQGSNIRIASSQWWLSQTQADDGCRSFECFKGINPSILEIVQSQLNFTFTITKEQVAGRKIENGSWTGEIGLATSGAVDFVVDNFAITAERMEILDYIPIYGPSHGRIYIRNPKESIDIEVYTNSLRRSSWFGLPLFCICVPFLSTLVNLKRKGVKGKPPTLLEWYAITFLALLRKGYNMKNSNRRTKITYISILLFGMVLFRLWKAMLISFFSVPSRTFPFHSLEEFLSKTDKKLVVAKGTIGEYEWRDAIDPVKQKVWNERILPYIDEPIYDQYSCGSFDIALEDDEYAIYKRQQGFPKDCDPYFHCEVVHSPFYVSKTFGSGWLFPKNSPFYRVFHRYVRLLHERGIVKQIRSSFDPRKGFPDQICPTYDGEAIGIKKSFSLFGIVLSGVAISAFTLFLEMVMPSRWFELNKQDQRNLLSRSLPYIF